MLGRRRVFTVELLGGRDRAGEAVAHGCIVPGVTGTYRRILDTADGCTPDLPEGVGKPRALQGQVPPPTLASWDSGVEMVAGDSTLATFPGLSQDSVSVEPMRSPEPTALAAPEPPSQLGQLLASRKLEQVLEWSQGGAHPSTQHCALPLAPWTRPGCAPPLLGAEAKLEQDLEEAEVVAAVVPRAWACLPGQGLRYLEHLCLVLEQMARLQQLYLQLRTQSPPEVSELWRGQPGQWGGGQKGRTLELSLLPEQPQPSLQASITPSLLFQDPEEEELALAPLPSLLPAPGSGVQGSEELQSLTKETGLEAASCSKVGMLSANPPRLPEAPVEPTDSFPPSQGHKAPSHWDRVKVLLNRIRRRSPGHPKSLVPPDGSGPRIESRDLSESPQCHPQQNAFRPSLVVKKQ